MNPRQSLLVVAILLLTITTGYALTGTALEGIQENDILVHQLLIQTVQGCNLTCENGGSCVSNGISSYCICPYGVIGNFCEYRWDQFDACSSMPCMNYGSCISSNNSYYCVCPSGTTGYRCEMNETTSSNTSCFLRPCENGGTCYAYLNSSYCSCPYGTSGTFCEYR
ncbi:unnamed protein product [Rotaria socialis]|uniref:EGF-like domain-containing protein n=1 Tax=Rotaria socialis TaxID=392032 RepID=A0A818SSS7_9BILA|nr:unnamed protein product [Rotaria socialis]